MTRRTIAILVALLALAAAPAATAAKTTPKVVGKVTALSGTKKLQVRAGKRLRTLHKGDKLTLDQVLVMGKGVKATIILTRPSGVKKGTELIQFTPAKGAKPVIRAKRRHGVVTVQIAPR
jgi:hypothetical protein